MPAKCLYVTKCKYGGKTAMCNNCKNNTLRNKEEDFYQKANDNPIPNVCPKLTYNGPAEQTLGYKCPVCNDYSSPYHLDRDDPRCIHCGYKFNLGR